MESPVVLDKPPEYHGNDRGFPFDDEEASGAWSELAARHPDIAARLRQRPATATWARKRRPSSQDATDDFGENFSGFDRFPFDDIPPEFREHFPTHWNRRFGSREEAPPQPPPHASPPPPCPSGSPSPPQPQPQPQTVHTQTQTEPEEVAQQLPQYGLRNTVDLGQRSPADPSLVHGEERAGRSMSAPPEPRGPEPAHVRHIPIFVEGRDEPVINRAAPGGGGAPAAPAPHVDRDAYFADDSPAFHPPPNFARAFGTPSGKPFRQGPQPFTQQKAYPQAAYRRASPSPQPPPPAPPAHEERYVKVPVQHQQAPPPAPREPSPPRAPKPPAANDPIAQILGIQTDVLNLMNEVENFAGTKKDKRYLFLDEMLTRNLIKLDNIETEGKENIRLARKEAIRCIQKCIAVLEAKAEKNGNPVDVAMSEQTQSQEVDMQEGPAEAQAAPSDPSTEEPPADPLPQEASPASVEQAVQADAPSQPEPSEEKPEEQTEVENKLSPKKKVVKKRDKSKDKAADSTEAKVSDKVEIEVMQVDNKGDKTEQVMDVDGAASQ